MFLNLKNKKITETIASQQAKGGTHPKTHREDSHERHSKEHKEIKSYRQHQSGVGKKPTGSTTLNTIQASNNSFTNIKPHFKIKIPQHEADGLQYLNRSQEKLDSFRMERVASAYRKIKKIDNNDCSYLLQDLDKSQEKIRKVGGKTKGVPKKEMLGNMTRNHICATEAEDPESRLMQQMNSNRSEMLQELLLPFLQLFSCSLKDGPKEHSYSPRELELKKSLQKQRRPGDKQAKKTSNQILIEEEERGYSLQRGQNLVSFVSIFLVRMDKVRQSIDSWSSSKKYKFVESPSIATFQQFYTDIQQFVTTLYQLCFSQIDSELKKCQDILTGCLSSERQLTRKNAQLQELLMREREKSKMMQNLALSMQQKSLYSTIFFNELSYGYDIDSHIRQKLFQEAKKNGLVSSFTTSQMSQNQLMKGHHRSGIELGNIYDNNQNEFTGQEMGGLVEFGK